MEQRCAEVDERHDFEREDDLFDIIWDADDCGGCAHHAFAEEFEGDQTSEQDQRKLAERIAALLGPAALEDHTKQVSINAKQKEWPRERPEDAEKRAAVAPFDLALDELPRQIAVRPEIAADCQRVEAAEQA